MLVKIYSLLYGKLCNSICFALLSFIIFKWFPSNFASILLIVSLVYLYYRSSGSRWNLVRFSNLNYHTGSWSLLHILNIGYCVLFFIVNVFIHPLIIALIAKILLFDILTDAKNASLILYLVIAAFITYKIIDSICIFLGTFLLQLKIQSLIKFRLVCSLILLCIFGVIKILAYLDPSKSLIISILLTLTINFLSFDSLKVIKCIKNRTTDFDNCELTSNQKFWFSLAKILTILGFVPIIISEFLADDNSIIRLLKRFLNSSEITDRGLRVFYFASIIIILTLLLALLVSIIWKNAHISSNHKLLKKD